MECGLDSQGDDELQAYLSSFTKNGANKRSSKGTKMVKPDWTKLMEAPEKFEGELNLSTEEDHLPAAASLYLKKPGVATELTHGPHHDQKAVHNSSHHDFSTSDHEPKVNSAVDSNSDHTAPDPASSYTDPSTSESLDLRKNVFSIEELGIAAAAAEEDSISETMTSQDFLAENLRNTYTIDDLENHRPQLSSTVEDRQTSSTQKNTAFSSHTPPPPLPPSPHASYGRASGFQFSAARTDTAGLSKKPVDSERSVEGSDGGYSDEEFESEVLSESEGEGEEEEGEGSATSESATGESLQDRPRSTLQVDASTQSNASTQSHASTQSNAVAAHNTSISEGGASSRNSHSEDGSLLSLTAAADPVSGGSRQACVRHISVQTDPPLPVQQPATVAPLHYGQDFLQTTPILPLVLSSDALEAVSTCYSPTAVALSDMLRAQLALTRQLIAGSQHTARSLAASITPSHHYTTLEDTKQFIARHRPRILTRDEARELVKQEEMYS